MVARPHELFAKAFNMQYAIGAFNASNLEVAQAICWAAEQTRAPVIVQMSEGAIEYAGLKTLYGIIASLAEAVSVPVVIHLDHGKNVDLIRQCIDAGCTSVMIDASTKPLAENIATTRAVVAIAHERGVWVEAELGSILGQEGAVGLGGSRTPDALLTKPQEAAQFVAETGIDALAVSVGTIHGAFTGQEYIRFELLEQIEKAVPQVPLVVHGASGIAAEHLQQVSTSNVCKINVDTELRMAFDRALRAALAQSTTMVDPRQTLGAGREAVQQAAAEKMRLFGCAGKG